MKSLFWKFIFIITIPVCGYSQSKYDYWLLEQRTPEWALNELRKSDLNSSFRISDYINPFYFENDFNGDKHIDIALLIESLSGSKGILIIHGGEKDMHVLGAGNDYEDIFSDFGWMDVWKVSSEQQVSVLEFGDNGDIKSTSIMQLRTVSLEIIKTESASGIIFWKNNKYNWAQVSD